MAKCNKLAILQAFLIFLSHSKACSSCNVTSCGPPPPVAACPTGVTTSLPRVECTYSNVTKSWQWKIIPCPLPVCDAASCGPQPGAPNFLCPDGTTVAGPGPCSFNIATGTCGYPIITCPSIKCNATSCGARPLFEILCPDGTSVGAGACVFNNETQKCGYEYPSCPPAPVCNATSCGPRPLYERLCPDGSVVGAGNCAYNNVTHSCGYEYPKCPPPPVCNTTTCGPRPLIANRLCPDGKTLAGPGQCSFNNASNTCGYPIITCPACKRNSDCKGSGLYCSTDGLCYANGTCTSNQDCTNPGNHYALPTFLPVGQIICKACIKGACGRKLTPCSQVCPSKTNFTNCNACSLVKGCLQCQSTCV